ncbi:hypothetical protein JXL83_06700 [candidate division WOR-3 bacterium]|nr:hypothetical protein [candidate division WOR-3 bacterium]
MDSKSENEKFLQTIKILETEFKLHPRLEIRDICKLILQASMGSDHLLGDRIKYFSDLSFEYSSLDENADTSCPLLQQIDTNKRIFRLHLAPLKRSELDKKEILRLLSVQNLLNRDNELFYETKEIMRRAVTEKFVNFDTDKIEAVCIKRRILKHSKSYGFASYRIVNDLDSPEFLFLKEFIKKGV